MVIMRRYALNILTVFLLLILTICDTALAEERQVYAAQGDVAFFKENDKIGLQSTDGTVLHAAEFDGTGYFDATGQANIYVDDKIGRIDRTGKIIVEPFACDEIEAIPTNCASEAVPPYVLLVSWYGADGEKVMQLMNTEGEWLSDTKFDLMLYEFENGKLFIRYEDQYNQIDTNGQLTSEVWWEYIFFAPLDEIRVDESFDRGRLTIDEIPIAEQFTLRFIMIECFHHRKGCFFLLRGEGTPIVKEFLQFRRQFDHFTVREKLGQCDAKAFADIF